MKISTIKKIKKVLDKLSFYLKIGNKIFVHFGERIGKRKSLKKNLKVKVL